MILKKKYKVVLGVGVETQRTLVLSILFGTRDELFVCVFHSSDQHVSLFPIVLFSCLTLFHILVPTCTVHIIGIFNGCVIFIYQIAG